MNDIVQINSAQKQLAVIEMIRKESIRGLGIFLLVAVVFLFLRIILKLVGANPETLFTGFIYLISDLFLLPFFNIFPQYNDLLPGESMVDAVAFLAIFCYLVLDLLAMAVVQVGSKIVKTGKQVNETVERSETIDTTVIDESIE